MIWAQEFCFQKWIFYLVPFFCYPDFLLFLCQCWFNSCSLTIWVRLKANSNTSLSKKTQHSGNVFSLIVSCRVLGAGNGWGQEMVGVWWGGCRRIGRNENLCYRNESVYFQMHLVLCALMCLANGKGNVGQIIKISINPQNFPLWLWNVAYLPKYEAFRVIIKLVCILWPWKLRT